MRSTWGRTHWGIQTMSPLSTLTTTPSTSQGGTLSEDEVFTVLSNRRRRFVIHALKRADGSVTVSELAKQVTAWECDLAVEEVQYSDRRNVQTTLLRTHLPTLEEKGVIRFVEDDVIEPTPALDEVDIYVEVLRGHEIPWSLYYTGLGGLSGSLLIANLSNLPVLGGVSPLSIALFTTVVFFVSAFAHYLIGQRMQLGSTDTPPELTRQQQ